MRMRNKKMPILLIAVMIISLATVGVGYGLWSETLYINGVVNSGEVDASWNTPGNGCFEFYPWPQGGYFGEVEGKDVGKWNIWVDGTDDRILHFQIDNGYPSYAVDCSVKYVIQGTVPVYGRGTYIWPRSSNLTNCVLTGTIQKTLACDQLTVIFTDNIGVQFHPGDVGASNLMVHVEQPAAQNSTYQFDVGVCVGQWNEAATADQCFAAAELP